jgi:rhodanese-related sulfurtransferase
MSVSGREAMKGAALIIFSGALLGIAFNGFGLIAERPWGLSWIGEDKLAALAKTEPVVAEEQPAADGYWTDVDDPLAVPTAARGGAGLPEIPAVGRPVQIELGALKRYYDAGAALIIDAREPEDYAQGHIHGALNIPYDVGADDPAMLESLDTGGRPIITYCSGGTCEVSLSLAEDLVYAGHQRVAVYIGGYAEWADAGYAVDKGAR